MILKFVAPGIAIALAPIVTVSCGLRASAIIPFSEVVAVLSRMAEGSLAIHVKTGGRNELGCLLVTVGHMCGSLVKTIHQVRNGSDSVNIDTCETTSNNLDLSSHTE